VDDITLRPAWLRCVPPPPLPAMPTTTDDKRSPPPKRKRPRPRGATIIHVQFGNGGGRRAAVEARARRPERTAKATTHGRASP